MREAALDRLDEEFGHDGRPSDEVIQALPSLIEFCLTPGRPLRADVIETLGWCVDFVSWFEPLTFAPLLTDDDPFVRRAALGLVGGLVEVVELADLLHVEVDADVRLELLAVLVDRGAVDELRRWTSVGEDPRQRVLALVGSVQAAPSSSESIVASIRAEIATMYELELPQSGMVLEVVNRALAERIEDRIAVNLDCLSSSSRQAQFDGVSCAKDLVTNWRGDFSAILDQLHDLTSSTNPELRERASRALWWIEADHPTSRRPRRWKVDLVELAAQWTDEPYNRRGIAEFLARRRRLDLTPFRPLIETELSRLRRHNSRDQAGSSGAVADDEELLRLCRLLRDRT